MAIKLCLFITHFLNNFVFANIDTKHNKIITVGLEFNTLNHNSYFSQKTTFLCSFSTQFVLFLDSPRVGSHDSQFKINPSDHPLSETYLL